MIGSEGMSAIVLAGGVSIYAGEGSSILSFRQKVFLEQLVTNLQDHFEEVIILVEQKEVVERIDLQGSRVCELAFKKCGPLGSIYEGLCKSSYRRSMIFSCDMPFVGLESISNLIAVSQQSPHDIYCYQTADGRVWPFPGIYLKEIRLLTRLLIDQEVRSVPCLFDVSDIHLTTAPIDTAAAFENSYKFGDCTLDVNPLEEIKK